MDFSIMPDGQVSHVHGIILDIGHHRHNHISRTQVITMWQIVHNGLDIHRLPLQAVDCLHSALWSETLVHVLGLP